MKTESRVEGKQAFWGMLPRTQPGSPGTSVLRGTLSPAGGGMQGLEHRRRAPRLEEGLGVSQRQFIP